MNSGGTQSAFAQSAKTMIADWVGSRKKVSLWLDIKVTRELEALEIIQRMKSKREFRRSVMVGLKIISELKQGRVETLLAEFPNIKELLGVKVGQGDGGLKDDIAELKRLLQEATITAPTLPAPPSDYPTMKPTGKPLGGFKPLSAPAFDDDDDALPLATKKAADTSAMNFLNALDSVRH